MAERRIISASRRTDIPAHYAEWFLGRLAAGWCRVQHPYTKAWLDASLAPVDVVGLVLWSRDFGPLLSELPAIRRRYPLYCQFTITGHPRALEPHAPPTDDAVAQARQLAKALGPGSIVWRFDPIVHTQHGGPEATLDRFRRLCSELDGATRRCTISFMSPYRRQTRAFAARGLVAQEPSPELRRELSTAIAELAAHHGMAVSACCNPDVVGDGVGRASCVDAGLLRGLGADVPERWPSGASRPGCGCDRSVDIGAYDTCVTGCAYCYANQDHALARRNHTAHAPSSPSLVPAGSAPESDGSQRGRKGNAEMP